METYYLACAYVLAGVLGLCVGSFLNVLIYRLPRGMNIAKPPSHCPACGYRLKWYDNIPVLSYCILRGRCRSCGGHISFRYTAVELLNCGLWLACVAAFWRYGIGYTVVCALALSALVVEFFADLETMTVPDSMTIGVALCGAAALVLEVFGLGAGISWQDRLWGALAGGGFFALFYGGSLLVLRREGLGFGDVKLMAAAGLLLGWQNLIVSVLFASLAAVLVMGIGRAFVRPAHVSENAEKSDDSAQGGVTDASAKEVTDTSAQVDVTDIPAQAGTSEAVPENAEKSDDPAQAEVTDAPAQVDVTDTPVQADISQNVSENADGCVEKEKKFEFPFVPFLASGIALALFFGTAICTWYMGLFA